MVKLINGDLLEAKETYIAHQVNCYGAMGHQGEQSEREKQGSP